ncbi:MAG: hypothetical protein R3F17_00655 [Planctomycetota bacterium]
MPRVRLGPRASRFVPLELEADAPPPSPAPVQFRRYIPGKGSPLWRGEADEWRFTQVPAHARRDATQEVKLKPAFLVQGAGEKSLSVVDELDGNQFNRIEIEATVFELGHAEISLALCRRGEVLAESPALTLWSRRPGPDDPRFSSFRNCAGGTRCSTRSGSAWVAMRCFATVSGMTLLQTDAEACLPRRSKGQVQYLTLGNENASGVGRSAANISCTLPRAMRANCTSPSPPAQLEPGGSESPNWCCGSTAASRRKPCAPGTYSVWQERRLDRDPDRSSDGR